MELNHDFSLSKEHFDILVAGGGVAGAAAALEAARHGKKVVLVEKSMKLGGLATLGLINFFVPMCNGRGKQIIFGMGDEFLKLSLKYGYGDIPADFKDGRIPEELLKKYREKGELPPRLATEFSAEIFALQLLELLVKEGVRVCFDTIISEPVMSRTDPGRVEAVIVENKGGRSRIAADMYVDVTGDADLLCRAGVPTVTRGNYHSYWCFMLTLEDCRRALEAGDIRLAHSKVTGGNANLYGGGHPEEIPLYDGTDPDEVNRYLIANQLELLSRFKDSDHRRERDLITIPGMGQFRTTRRIDGDYVLQEDDIYRHFEDSVAVMNDFDRRDFLFEIPYRTLVRTGFPNLITAGRSAAADGYAWDCLRVIPPAILTGQAAGLAASRAIDESTPITGIDIPRLQETLAAENMMIHFDDADVPEDKDLEAPHELND
ncbi:MAG: FAD-dependent oxidoreductase [Lachnospiraceae bacterium]|nr:FAD-dependent oxidoreductase [Lachnospiraceae bacterium]